MSRTEIDKQELKRIEQKLWQLVLLAITVILFLTLAMLVLQIFGLFQEDRMALFSDKGYRYSVSLALVVLLFCIYMITQQRNLSGLSEALFKEREAAHILSQNVKTLSSLMEVSSVINSGHKLSDILDIITQEMLVCFQADQSSIMLLDEESGYLKTEAALGRGSEIVKDTKMPMGEGVAGRVIRSGRPLLLNGKADPDEFPGACQKARFIRSALCVPLKTGEQCIGVLNVNLIDKQKMFTEAHLDLISIFANNAAVAIHNAKLSEERNKRRQLQTMLERLHSPQVVHELVKGNNGQSPHKMRKKVEMTILFADIRGFSNLLNAVRLEEMMEFLDEYYSAMTETVFDHGGSIDKFIGDEVMAFFGAPAAQDDFNENGLKAAMEMKACFQELRRTFSTRSPAFKSLALGIGINTGEVIVGTIGSNKRYEYTVIGAAVNIARRLCSHAEYDQILTTQATLEKTKLMVPSEFVGDILLKGVAEPVLVHQITESMLWVGSQGPMFACERKRSDKNATEVSYH